MSLWDFVNGKTQWREIEDCLDVNRQRSCFQALFKHFLTLVNSEQLQKNRYYISSLIYVVGFLEENQLPLRGKLEGFDNMSEGGSGLSLSLLDYTIKKDPELGDVVKTVPCSATYTCHDMQNEFINTLSSVVTKAIVEEVSD